MIEIDKQILEATHFYHEDPYLSLWTKIGWLIDRNGSGLYLNH